MGNDTMAFTKLVKNSAYFSRYQVKYKRRRSGKTDYAARKKLISQAKNKYNAPKYRLVVRFTKKDIICQIITSEISGDKVFAAAYAHELPRYGVTHGLTNWAAAYCTGLLVARRALTKLQIADMFPGVEEADGEYKLTEAADVDGEERCPGYDIETKELDADTLRRYIFGGHVAEYMETLADDDEERYKSQFSGYIEDEIEADGLEELYSEAHSQIREDPFKKDPEAGSKKSKEEWKAESKKYRTPKKTKEQKEATVQQKIKELAGEV